MRTNLRPVFRSFMIVISFVTLHSLLAGALHGQVQEEWIARYNGPNNKEDIACDIALDDAGDIYVTGYSGSEDDYSYLTTIKYNETGDSLWTRKYDRRSDIFDLCALEIDKHGNLYAAGSSIGDGTEADYTVIKYDSNGDELWDKTYNGPGNAEDLLFGIVIDNLNNICTTGSSFGNGTDYDFTTIKYNPNGDVQWIARFNGVANGFDRAYGLVVDPLGDVYVTGYSEAGIDSFLLTTIKYDGNTGDSLWVGRYEGPCNIWAHRPAITIDDFGGIYVTGGSKGSSSCRDYITIKYNQDNGDTLWVRRYDGPYGGEDGPMAIKTDRVQNVYVTGSSDGNGTDEDYLTINYGLDGTIHWIQRYDGSGQGSDMEDWPWAIAVDETGNVYVTGGSTESDNHLDLTTIRYNVNGNTDWVESYTVPGNNDDMGTAIVVDQNDNVYVTGASEGIGTEMDYITIKYRQGPVDLEDNNIQGQFPLRSFKLSQNYPNPFNPSTTIPFYIPDIGKKVEVKMIVNDIRGRVVRNLVNDAFSAGLHSVVWDGRDDRGRRVSSGFYFYTLRSGDMAYTRKIALLK